MSEYIGRNVSAAIQGMQLAGLVGLALGALIASRLGPEWVVTAASIGLIGVAVGLQATSRRTMIATPLHVAPAEALDE